MEEDEQVAVDQEDDDAPIDVPPPSTPNVVIDPGSGIFKAGFAGEEYPRDCFPTVVGWPKVLNEKSHNEHRKRRSRISQGEHYSGEGIIVGEHVMSKKANYTLSYPISRGAVKKWDELEIIYDHVLLEQLEVDPEETKVLLTSSPFHSKKTMEEQAEILFELFGVSGLAIINQAVLTLYSTGRTTGLVIDSGDELTTCVPIVDNFIIGPSQKMLNIGGRDLTGYMQRILTEKGYYFVTSMEHHIIRELKEEFGFCALDFEAEMQKKDSEFTREFSLPDGQTITLDKECFRCVEPIFKPSLIGMENDGITDMAMRSFKACDVHIKSLLYNSIVLSGGNTLFKGFAERFKNDLDNHEFSFKKFKVSADPVRQFSSWKGGSVLAALSTFDDFVATIDDYNNYGARCVHTRMNQ